MSRTARRFARLPNRWIFDGGLERFRTSPSHRGVTGAALKVLVAILLRAEHAAAASAGPNQGSAALTYSELEQLTDLSRAMVSKGLRRLEAEDLISTTREGQGGKGRYRLSGYGPDDTYGRMSVSALYGQGSTERIRWLHQISLRNEADLNAIKLYLLFCAHANKESWSTTIGYTKIEEKTGINDGRTRRALSVLYEHNLVRVRRIQDGVDGRNPPNTYDILGL